jgi:seryl-tRNA synthetase
MPKPELEFFDPESVPWQDIEGWEGWIREKIVSRDPDSGDYTRILDFKPGTKTTETLVHDFWEEVYIISGALYDIAKDQHFKTGYYACRPPGMIHGPYDIPEGCVTFEIRYYK